MKITKEKLIELKAQVADNMADAEVGPLLDEIDRLSRDVVRLRGYIKDSATCPRCYSIFKCIPSCTFESDCPVDAAEINYARAFLKDKEI